MFNWKSGLFHHKILALAVFLLLFLGATLISISVSHYQTDPRVKADDLTPWCDQPNNCCDQLARTGDPDQCSWPERKYCKPAQCAAIPSGMPVKRCGLAYIEDYPYGCVGRPPGGFPGSPKEPVSGEVTAVPMPSSFVTPKSTTQPTSSIGLSPTLTLPAPTDIKLSGPTPIIVFVTDEPRITITGEIPIMNTPTLIPKEINKPSFLNNIKIIAWWETLQKKLTNFILYYLP